MEDDLNYENLMDDVTEAIKKFNLVIFIGAGVSIAQGYPNWNNYIEHLIKYWQGQVLSVSGEKRLGREHHVVFDLISKSSISNKRKVDLVNYELKKVFGEDFEKRRLDFEKGYFKNLLPYSIVNQTVESLASLNAIFITSNYDYEIENHIKRLKNAVVTINDLNEFTKNKNGKLQFGDVLHIHGTPDCDVKYFVSSSADYSKTYLKNRENFENLVTWFKETKPKEWLGALFKFDSSANYLVTIFYLLYNENLKKNRFALFIEELSDYLTTYNQKLSLRGMNYKLNHEELNNFDLLKKMFLKLMETDKIENDIFYLDGIKSILPLLSLDDRRNVLQHIQKQNNCPPPEIEELQRIIVN